MPTNRRFDAIPTQPLSDEAVIHIHNALENYLHLFENHYANQIGRYYDQQRSQYHTPTGPTQVRGNIDPNAEPF